MRRILFCVLIGIAPLLIAQTPNSVIDSLVDLSRRGQFTQLIEAANTLLTNDKLPTAAQGMALLYLGFAYQQRGEFNKATTNYEKSLAVINRDGQHPSEYATTLGALATLYAEIGQIDTAKHVMLRSLHLFEDEGDHAGAAMIWNDLATVAADQHSLHDAHKNLARAIAESQLAKDLTQGQLAALTTTEGRIAELDKDPRTAISDYQRALDLWKLTHNDQQQKMAWLYVLLGGAYLQAGDIPNAREAITHGLAMLEASSGRDTPRYLAAELTYSKVLDASGAHDEASRLRKDAQANLKIDADRQRTQSEISVNALR